MADFIFSSDSARWRLSPSWARDALLAEHCLDTLRLYSRPRSRDLDHRPNRIKSCDRLITH